jgi:hypothetical protein
VAWAAAAVNQAWNWWRPAAEASPDHDVAVLDHLVAVATGSAPGDLAMALDEWKAQPSHAAPPPWIGHFYGALHGLLDARLAEGEARDTRVAECLDYCCCGPDGTHRAGDVAALAG